MAAPSRTRSGARSTTAACARGWPRVRAVPASGCQRGTPLPPRWRRLWRRGVGDFSAAWLTLREPADHAARSDRLARRAGAAIGTRRPVRIVDLGCGTGSNRRYLTTRLPLPQRWLLVDRDP